MSMSNHNQYEMENPNIAFVISVLCTSIYDLIKCKATSVNKIKCASLSLLTPITSRQCSLKNRIKQKCKIIFIIEDYYNIFGKSMRAQ